MLMARPKTKTKAQSVNEYAKRNYDDIRLQVKKGGKDLIRVHAERQGLTVQGYIKAIISADMGGAEL